MATNSFHNSAQKRLLAMGGVFVLWTLAVVFRLVNLQIFQYRDYSDREAKQHDRYIPLAAKRGTIYDRLGHELAASVMVESAFIVPGEAPDLASAVSLVTGITGDDPHVALANCQSGKTFCWVARKADAETIQRIRNLNLRGIHFQREPKRYYPQKELAAQLLGYVGDDQGLSGIERLYEEQLQGQPGAMVISVDARKHWYNRTETEGEPGSNIVLTIDEYIQYVAERELERAIQETHAIAGTVIVMNPRTGEVLALANWPTFNPNRRKAITNEGLKNRAVSDIYEPGSTFKVVTVAAALEEKVTKPDEIFDCQMGKIVIDKVTIHDHKPFGLMPVSDIIAHSSDVGAIKIAMRLGDQRFYKYIRLFGFGQPTGVELPAETRGMTKPVERWSHMSLAAIAMGQEIGVSPIQLAAMMSSIANDGVWLPPHVVAGTVEPKNSPQQIMFHPSEGRRVLSPVTAAQMRQMLQGVVLHGTAPKAILEGYSSAGKTGTAQKLDPATGTYSKTKYVGSFAGFAPVNNPALTVAVILDSAQGLHQGGQVAAPVFQRIMQQVLEYQHVAHDVEISPDRKLLLARRNAKTGDVAEDSPDHLGATLVAAETPDHVSSAVARTPVIATKMQPAANHWQEKEEEVRPLGEPTVPLTAPATKLAGTVVFDQESVEVPSLVGKSLRAALEISSAGGFDLEPMGTVGVVKEQAPPAGSRAPAGSRVVVRLGK